MITLNDKVMAFMATRTDIQSASQIAAQCKGNNSAIAMALTKLVRAGKLKRVGRGFYAVPGAIAANIAFASISAAPKPELQDVRPSAPAAADQDPDDDQVTVEEPADDVAPEPLVYSLWNDGEMVIKRGDVNIVLSAPEVNGLVAFLAPRAS